MNTVTRFKAIMANRDLWEESRGMIATAREHGHRMKLPEMLHMASCNSHFEAWLMNESCTETGLDLTA